ncbi:hypothetical protein LR48_Vigan10g074300 [Vigna angularis]|uniref:Uncharacterized protein n=1 Tax=Phaseolus angularis TaxID=3914 RepID=A0A0L9VIG5_PHAAN|nr:hypothetical protein LR48_Vigan10g074300 [Vigna angularis]
MEEPLDESINRLSFPLKKKSTTTLLLCSNTHKLLRIVCSCSTKETLSVELVKYCYGDRGITGSSLVCLRKCAEEEVMLREVFGGSVSSFVKILRRCCFLACGIKGGVF